MKNRVNKILAFFVTAVMSVCMLSTAVSAESIFSQAKLAESGKKYSANLLKDKDSDWIYKVVLSKKGTLKVNFSFDISSAFIILFDENGNCIKPNSVSMTTGKDTHWNSGHFNNADGTKTNFGYATVLRWNEISEKSSGTLTYEYLDKGTYYITYDYETGAKGAGKASFTMTFPSKNGKSASADGKIKGISSYTMETGTTVKFSLDISPEDAEVEWTSSNEKVASVSASGKVTAKKAGTAIITAKSGKSSIKIKIIVE